MEELVFKTSQAEEFLDITEAVRAAVKRMGIADGICFLYCPHTTAGLTINEHVDPTVAEDLRRAYDAFVPVDANWKHLEGNAPAHIKASLVGENTIVAIQEGNLALGTWQGIFLCEFDGPRTRKVWLRILP